MSYTIYILQCNDNTLYTGIAKNLENRLETHRSGKGSRYVAARLPVTVVYQEQAESRSAAQKREFAIKQLPRSKKQLLILSYQQDEKQ